MMLVIGAVCVVITLAALMADSGKGLGNGFKNLALYIAICVVLALVLTTCTQGCVDLVYPLLDNL